MSTDDLCSFSKECCSRIISNKPGRSTTSSRENDSSRRIESFLDDGTFVGSIIRQHDCQDFGMERKLIDGDSVITGYGKVKMTRYLFAHDALVVGGTYPRFI